MSNRLPIQPLLDAANATSLGVLADCIGRSRRTIHRWKNDGVPEGAADAAAIAIGSHPAYVWMNEWAPAT